MPPSATVLRAFRHRNYRLFFSGQSVSLVGTWVTRIATSWLVYRLTGSAWWLGVVGFVGQLPTLLLAPVAGVLVDRWNRHRILVVTQVLSMLQSAALAALAFAGRLSVGHILALQALQGVINAFDTPARQAFVVQMVEDRADLPNAIALNSSMFNGSRIVGPAIGGALLAAAGEGWCFALDAASYVAVIASLLAMRLPASAAGSPTTPAAARAGVGADLREGVRYAFGFPPVRSALVLVALMGLFGMPYTTLMPAVAAGVLGGGPHTLGRLMTAGGLGALVGAFYLAGRSSVVGLGRVIMIGAVSAGLALVCFALSRSLWLSLAIMPVVGGAFMVTTASANTVLQTILPEALRGRVMALYTVAFLGTAPIGSLLAGAIAARVGTPLTILGGGVGCALAGLWFARVLPSLRAHVRPIYAERGIIERIVETPVAG
ncbi:MAG TPA: MFS transporter [Gemmatimonadaceae bacterium]|nr:MFS transporter [Gemmatimonadaceae bacterium]